MCVLGLKEENQHDNLMISPEEHTLPQLDELRRDYVAAVDEPERAEQHYQTLQSHRSSLTPLLLAFYAGFEALVAKHKWNPYDKLKLLNAATEKFEQAVEQASGHAEIRFLRFSVEHYLPDFLKKNNHLEEDRRVIFQQFDATLENTESRKAIARFMLESGRCGRAETKKYQTVLEAEKSK